MIFLFAAVAFMAGSVFLIRRIAGYFGIMVDNRALLLCAVMALVVNFTSIILSAYLTAGHIIVLVLMVILSAAIVTFLNEFLVRRSSGLTLADGREEFSSIISGLRDKILSYVGKKQEEPAQVSLPAEIGQTAEIAPAAASSAAVEAVNEKTDNPVENILNSEPIPDEKKADSVPAPAYSADKVAAAVEAKADNPAPVPATAVEAVNEVSEVPEVSDAAREAPLSNAVTVLEKPEDDFHSEPVKVEEPDVPNEEVNQDEPGDEIASEYSALFTAISQTENEKPASAENFADKSEKAEEDDRLKKCSTLDELLDYAYSETDAHHEGNAIKAYRRAIDEYGSDPYAPFLVIELGNIYKELGRYEDACDAYSRALLLPALDGQDSTRAEFLKTASYLESVNKTLTKHGCSNMPFSKIPPDLLEEIERVFDSKNK